MHRKKEPSGLKIISPENARNTYYAGFIEHQYRHTLRTDWLKFIAQIIVLLVSISISVVSTILLIIFVKQMLNNSDRYVQLSGIIASLVSYSALIIGLFKIIIEYLFNRDDDKNRNDLINNIITYDSNHLVSESDSFEDQIDDLLNDLASDSKRKKAK